MLMVGVSVKNSPVKLLPQSTPITLFINFFTADIRRDKAPPTEASSCDILMFKNAAFA